MVCVCVFFRTVTVTNATDLFNLLLTIAHKENTSDYVNILLLDAKYEKMAPLDFEYCTMVRFFFRFWFGWRCIVFHSNLKVSLRLSIYLIKFTTIVNDFFKSVRFAISKNEIMVSASDWPNVDSILTIIVWYCLIVVHRCIDHATCCPN